MKSTLIEITKSKWACPACGEKNIINTSETGQCSPKRFMVDNAPIMDEAMHYHCCNCSHEFAENEDQKKIREKAQKEEKKELPSYPKAFLITAAMFAVIAVILFHDGGGFDGDGGSQDLFESIERRELFLLREAS